MALPVGICGLCGQRKELIESHIIPRTIVQWVKDTSATGYLRSAKTPNRRMQDGVKKHLLCAACDNGLLNPSEKDFMENVFRPYHADKTAVLSYGPKLHFFAASLAFRVMLLEESRPQEERRKEVPVSDFQKPLAYLRRYLRGFTLKPDGLEHYVTLADNVDDMLWVTETEEEFVLEHGLPGRMGFDLMRGLDAFALNLAGHLITFVQVPGFLFATVIKPRKYRGTLGTRLRAAGGALEFDAGDLLSSDLLQVVMGRSRQLDGITMSEQQARKLEEALKGNPERWKNSETARLAPFLRRPR